MGLGDVESGLADPADAGADRAVRRAPAEHQHLGLAWGSSTSSGGQRGGDPSTLACADADHQVVVGRVVGDVAVAVGLLEAADAVLEAGCAGDRPRTGQRLLVAQVGQELLDGLAGRPCRDRVGAGGEGGVDRRAGRRRRGPSTARSRWPGSRRKAGSPGCGR